MRLVLSFALIAMNSLFATAPMAKVFSEPHATVEAAAEHAVKEVLLDPDSAKLRFWKMIEGTTSSGTRQITVCGMVNAKNRLGGYAGFSPFRAIVLNVGDEYGGIIANVASGGKNGLVHFYESHPECRMKLPIE